MNAALEQGKCIAVDGAAAIVIKHRMQFGTFNFPGLFDVFLNDVGECRVIATTPLFTLDPQTVARSDSIEKELSAAGFELVTASSANEADDRVIKDLIDEVSPVQVKEIVIMTSDVDFLPILRRKASQGIKVFWVSTKQARNADDVRSLAAQVDRLCERGVFTFVDLQKFRRKIVGKREDDHGSNDRGFSNGTSLYWELSLKGATARDVAIFQGELARLEMKFPSLQCRSVDRNDVGVRGK